MCLGRIAHLASCKRKPLTITSEYLMSVFSIFPYPVFKRIEIFQKKKKTSTACSFSLNIVPLFERKILL